MELTWIGHSCFRLRGKDATLITDPFAQSAGYSLGRVTADVITVSNSHPHHATTAEIGGEPTILDGPGEYEVHGITITGVRTPPSKTATDGVKNTAYIVSID